MMYYRRKILLSILEAFGGQLTRTQLQKLAFVFTRWQAQPAFDFVPYHYGCYSFQANQDLGAMRQTGLLEEQALGAAEIDGDLLDGSPARRHRGRDGDAEEAAVLI